MRTDRHDVLDRRQPILDRLEVTEELGAHHDDPRLRVLDDVQHLRRREPPVHRHANGAQLGQATDDVEELGAVLLDVGDPVAESDSGRPERLRGPTGPRVKLGEGDGPVADDECRRVRAARCVHADDVGDGRDIGIGHGQLLGCSRCRFIIALTAPGAMVLTAWAVTAMRGAMRTGRTRAAVIIQSAASSALNPGRPS